MRTILEGGTLCLHLTQRVEIDNLGRNLDTKGVTDIASYTRSTTLHLSEKLDGWKVNIGNDFI